VGSVLILGTVIGIMAAYQMREPTKEEMQNYLDVYFGQPGIAPKYLKELQQQVCM